MVGRMEATFKIGVTVAAAAIGITVVTRAAGLCDAATGVMLRDSVGCPPCMIHLAELKSIWVKFGWEVAITDHLSQLLNHAGVI